MDEVLCTPNHGGAPYLPYKTAYHAACQPGSDTPNSVSFHFSIGATAVAKRDPNFSLLSLTAESLHKW